MKATIVSLAAAALLLPASVFAATCPDVAPAAILAPSADSAKCLSAIAKAGSGYVKAKMKSETKCMAKNGADDPTACPTIKDVGKTQKAAVKGSDKIAKACDSAAIAGLASSHSTMSAAEIASCMLSQHQVETAMVIGETAGTANNYSPSKERAKCEATLGKAATKYVTSLLKNMNKCVDGQVKGGAVGDLSPACVGSYSGGSYVPPTDTKTADKIAKLLEKTEASIQKACGDNAIANANIPNMFACAGSTTVDDLKNCVVCRGFDRTLGVLGQQYAEDGAVIAGTIQAAVDAASGGDKLLIPSGDYEEEVVITTSGLSLVGCGGATDDRPRITPVVAGSGDGIFSTGVDDLLFQSLEVFAQESNGIRNVQGDGLTYRDIVGDGNNISLYSVFPVESSNVLIEACLVERVIDAGLYVGQSTNIVVRHNRIQENVAGLEIENSSFAEVHNNLATNNAGGLLEFKLPGLLVQDGNDNYFHHNVSVSNNRESTGFALPDAIVGTIPTGTGFLSFSNDNGEWAYNVARDNGSFGFAMSDQEGLNTLAALGGNDEPFPTPSPDQTTENNSIHDNVFAGNGGMPDTTPPNDTPLSGNTLFVLGDEVGGNHNNCFTNNQDGGGSLFTANDCTP